MKKEKKQLKFIAKHGVIPHLCQIELTYACNADCIFCYNPDENIVRNMDTIDKVVYSVAKSEIPHVYLFGGEPSLFPVKKLNEYIDLLSEHSSVTLVTNGIIRMEGISKKLACFGVPIHGHKAELHEFFNRRPGSFGNIIENIKYYVECGHDVRCIPVLTAYNYDDMYKIIELADSLEMESIYVDRYEDGGKGAMNASKYNLKPTLEQFSEAVGQIIQAKKDFPSFNGMVGFGTAIPYCLDERLDSENMNSSCGAGTTFCTISPKGELRICNQSRLIFGNVLNESIETIWNKSSLNIFRDLSWVTEPCTSCTLLLECLGGCKVDVNCSDKFCVDYAVRGLKSSPNPVHKKEVQELDEIFPNYYRFFCVDKFLKLTEKYSQKFLVTQYQTIEIDDLSAIIIKRLIEKEKFNEKEMIDYFFDMVEEIDIRKYFNQLLRVTAIQTLNLPTK